MKWYWFTFRNRLLPVTVHVETARRYLWGGIYGVNIGPWFVGAIKGDVGGNVNDERGMHKDDPRKERTPWCVECKKKHAPTAEHPPCFYCHGFLHKPIPPDLYFDFKGWRFTAPFYCMACGRDICYRQWAFARCCGACDLRRSSHRLLPHGKIFAGPHVLIDQKAEHCFAADAFIDPADAEEYPHWPDPNRWLPRPPQPRPTPKPRKPFSPRRGVM